MSALGSLREAALSGPCYVKTHGIWAVRFAFPSFSISASLSGLLSCLWPLLLNLNTHSLKGTLTRLNLLSTPSGLSLSSREMPWKPWALMSFRKGLYTVGYSTRE